MPVKVSHAMQQLLVPVIGEEGAIALILYWGNNRRKEKRLYVPKILRDDHPLIAALGKQRALALCEAFGGDRLRIPTGEGRGRRKGTTQTVMVKVA